MKLEHLHKYSCEQAIQKALYSKYSRSRGQKSWKGDQGTFILYWLLAIAILDTSKQIDVL